MTVSVVSVSNNFQTVSVYTEHGITVFCISYGQPVARMEYGSTEVTLDERYWNRSRTTMRHLSLFLRKSPKEIRQAVKKGIYKLERL